ncbi:MAG: HAD family hydrolase [Gammaproteobacteria bacterium]|nr:MAG: HAD family hydrolase [Gammaproteobacteria bacterium]
MKPYQLLVFDWDGTLMDSAYRIVACMQRAARDTGQPVPTERAVHEIIGLGMREAVRGLYPGLSEPDTARFIDAYRTHWLGDEVPASSLFPGARETLEWALENDYLLAVATGKSRRGLDKVLEETGLRDCFHVTRCADEAFSKPHPQMLEEILTDLDTAPQAALVIGDSEYDMQMAANARVPAVGVSHGVHDPERLRASGALHILQQLSELPIWLKGQRQETPLERWA